MSNNQQPKHPTTLQQLAGVFGSMTQATNKILGGHPGFVDEVRNLYTHSSHPPLRQEYWGTVPPPHPRQPHPLALSARRSLASRTLSTHCPKQCKAFSPRQGPKPPSTTTHLPLRKAHPGSRAAPRGQTTRQHMLLRQPAMPAPVWSLTLRGIRLRLGRPPAQSAPQSMMGSSPILR